MNTKSQKRGTLNNQEILNSLGEKIKASERSLAYLKQCRANFKVLDNMETTETLEKWLGPEPLPKDESKMSEIEKTKKEIENLQTKVKLLEYQETVREPWEKAYRNCYGHFPITGMDCNEWDAMTINAFKKGYENAQNAEEISQTLYDVCLEWWQDLHFEKLPRGYDPLNFLVERLEKTDSRKPPKAGIEKVIENSSKTPAEEAYKEWYGGYPSNGIAIDNSWDAFQAGYNAACEEPPQEEVNTLQEKKWKVDAKSLLKPPTLYDCIANWWDEIFTNGNSPEENIESLIEQIELFLPKEQSTAGSQNAYVESAVEGFNDAIKQIKSKLR